MYLHINSPIFPLIFRCLFAFSHFKWQKYQTFNPFNIAKMRERERDREFKTRIA